MTLSLFPFNRDNEYDNIAKNDLNVCLVNQLAPCNLMFSLSAIPINTKNLWTLSRWSPFTTIVSSCFWFSSYYTLSFFPFSLPSLPSLQSRPLVWKFYIINHLHFSKTWVSFCSRRSRGFPLLASSTSCLACWPCGCGSGPGGLAHLLRSPFQQYLIITTKGASAYIWNSLEMLKLSLFMLLKI